MPHEPRRDHDIDIDSAETREWLESLEAVIERDGFDRARFLLSALCDHAERAGAALPWSPRVPYVNTVAPDRQPQMPGDRALEERILGMLRWNAMAIVVRAQKAGGGVGGHIATYQSVATLFEVGFNHFWRARTDGRGGDLVLFQGHAAPGVYARAFLEGRLTEGQLDRFRREIGQGGLSSYPHPWLMPHFWEHPTVSMGLGPLTAIYQARFMKYLHHRDLLDTGGRHVWAFLGDGEMDEPESLGAITVAGREKLDNLVFVVNCNLQRLDGPVRGNGKIVRELGALFRGAGWNVIQLLWGSEWDDLLARDRDGILERWLSEVPDGEFQGYASRDGAYMREHFFGKDPALKALVAHLSDEQVMDLRRGGHDPVKVYAAFDAAVKHTGQPTLILAQTIKGYGMGKSGQGLYNAHQQKKMDDESIRRLRDRLNLPIADDRLAELPYVKPSEDSPEVRYLKDRRRALGGSIPARRTDAPKLPLPSLDSFAPLLQGSGDREQSTTMAFVRFLSMLLRDKPLAPHLVPIVADEARTFGMEGMFRQLGIYAPTGQLYRPVDADQLMFYREEKNGQILQEGINEAGAFGSWVAAGTSYANHGIQMIPFYIFYSMFGFQRIGDFIWAAADMQARGFLIGATSGRTTLNGEGLQHEDGHSHLFAATVPNCIAYDPTFSYELAVIMHDGLRRMNQEDEHVFYYITTLNENYTQPPMPQGAQDGIRKGMYLFRERQGAAGNKTVQLMGCGAILREVIAAADILEADYGVAADIWSVPSFNELRRDGLRTERYNLLHPDQAPRQCHVEACLADRPGPVVASTDYMRAFADQIRPFVRRRYEVLGTDGFGRSDTREKLRRFFEVDRHYVTLAALRALAAEGALPVRTVQDAIARFGIDTEAPDPTTI